MKKNAEIKEISDKLFSAGSVVLYPHINPDGDSVGSCAALSLALRAAGIECWVYSDAIPKYLDFINTEAFTSDWAKVQGADICAAIDCSDENRLDERLESYEAGKERICLDHHVSEMGFGDVYYINEKAAAVCEVIYDILKAGEITFTRDIANALYTGIVTDTGGFRHSNTTERTHEIAADLFRIGVDHTNIIVNLYNNKGLKKVRCESLAIERMMLFAGGKGVISYLTSSDLAALDARHEDADEIIDRLRDIEGVEMAAYLEERENGIKVSMRSKTDTSVLDICIRNGGGGHAKAAGCTVKMTMEDAFALFKDEMESALIL